MISFRDLQSLRSPLHRAVALGLAILTIGSLLHPRHLSAENTTLRLAGDEWFLSSLTKTATIAAFERETGIHVEVVFKNDRAIMSELDRGPSSGESGLDIIVVRHRLLGALVQKHQVRPIDEFLANPGLHDRSFVPQEQLFANWWRKLSSYGDHIYGYPFTGLTTFLCYRKDLLDSPDNRRDFRARFQRDLSLPKSWREYNEVAEFFTRPGEQFFGTYIQGKQALALWYEWLNLAYSFGGNILDARHGWEYGDIVVNSPQNVAATAEYMKLMGFSPPDTLGYGWNEAQSALQEGKVFMGLLWDDQAPFLEDPRVSKVSGKLGYALIPSNSRQPFSQLEGLTYLIPTQSEHPQEAYRFLEFAMSPSAQLELTLHGGMSLRKSTYENPRARRLPYAASFLASVDIAEEKPTIPESSRMTDAMVRRLAEIVSGKATPQAGLDRLALDLQGILGDRARLRYPVKTAEGTR